MNRKEYINVKKWFKNYINNLAAQSQEKSKKIKNKYIHCKRTAKTAEIICRSLKMNKEEIPAVVTAGLIHDIGKIRQYYDKTTEDHGIYGRKLIDKSSILQNIHEKEYILNAVEFHNKCDIPEKIGKTSEKYVKILRDADKLDLLYVITHAYTVKNSKKQWFAQRKLPDTPGISDKIRISLENEYTADYSEVKNNNDLNCLFLSWIYDINFTKSFILLKKNNITGKILKEFTENGEFREIIKKIDAYIKRRINGHNNSR